MTVNRRTHINRTNAVLSTGPRTIAGKSRSALNSIKHGLTAVNPVLTGEDKAEWLKCLKGVIDSLGPTNFLEMELAHGVAHQVWKQKRLRQHETDMAKSVVERHIRKDENAAEIIDTRDLCESQQRTRNAWPRHYRLVCRLLAMPRHESISTDDVRSFFDVVVGIMENPDVNRLLSDDRLLVTAGYKLPIPTNEELVDSQLYEEIKWTRRSLDRGLRFLAKRVGLSLAKFLTSLDGHYQRQFNSTVKTLQSNQSYLADLEKKAIKNQAAKISADQLAERSETQTLQRLESQASKQILNSLRMFAELRGIQTPATVESNLSIGIAVSGASASVRPHQPGATMTDIEGIEQLESPDERAFEAAQLVDSLAKQGEKALS